MDRILNPFWTKAVEFLPMWMAPNLVTLIGFGVLVLNTISYLPFDLTMTKPFNPILYYFSAISIFIYQTLDAIDGKQARRTGTSSPLGQLFDHGCDAWSTVLTIFIPM
jgi:ethanolaminephosphotransferase